MAKVLEEELVDKFIEHRKKRQSLAEFAIELLKNEFNIEKLVQYAIKKGQNLPLGYVCEVVSETLPDSCNGIRKKVSDLAGKLYSMPKNWQYIYDNLEDVVKWKLSVIATPINKKWMVYSQFEEQARDWLNCYLRKNPLPQ